MASEIVDTRVSLGTSAATTRVHDTLSARERTAQFLMLGVWFGLLTGFAEVTLLAARKLWSNQIFPAFNPHALWMAPLADLGLFTAVGLVLLCGALLTPRLFSLRLVNFVFAFLAFLSLLLTFTQLAIYAVLLLAIGLAVQTARLMTVRDQRIKAATIRRSAILMLVLVAAMAVGVHGWQLLAERQSLAGLPAASPDAPNVLVITLDTVRAQSLSLHGYGRPTTPQLERMSKAGVRFERALVTAPWTLPSHASMFTGHSAGNTSTDWFKPLDAVHPTLAEALSRQGYATGGFVANLSYCTSGTGLNRGFVHYEDYPISAGQIVLSSRLATLLFDISVRKIFNYRDLLNRKPASELNRDFLSWLSRNERRPFFAFLNYHDAHEPFLPPPPFDAQFGPNGPSLKDPFPSPQTIWTKEEVQLERDAYDGSIAYLDQQLGLLYDELQRRGKLENTMIIITSDHGHEFSEHGIMGHGFNLYMTTLHVPLLILFPSRVPAGANVPEAVSLSDLPSTVMDLLKLKDAVRFPGNSLARYWDGTRDAKSGTAETLLSELDFAPNVPASYPISKGDMKSLVAGEYHYIKNGDGSEELYNFQNDPNETNNLSHSEKERHVLEQFRASLKSRYSFGD